MGRKSGNKDFPRSRDVHYIPRLLLTNTSVFQQFADEWSKQTESFIPCEDLLEAYQTEISPFENYEYHTKRFVHSMPGQVTHYRVAFTHTRLITKLARMHQLIYFRERLVLIDAKMNAQATDGTLENQPQLPTPYGNLRFPHPKAPEIPSFQGFRDSKGRWLALHHDVNLHLRFLVNPALFAEMVQTANQDLLMTRP